MSRGKNSRETIFVSQLSRKYPHREGKFERGKKALLWGRGNLGGILGDNLGEGNCEPKIVARQSLWGVIFCREASRCLAGPSGREWPLEADFRVHAKGVVLCERACFCLLSAFYNTPPSKNPSKNLCLY